MSEPHSAQHCPARGVMNMLALQQADLLPHVLQVVNHGNLTSLNAAPVTLQAEAHGIDADFFTLPAKLRCPANMTRTNPANWLALAASSCAGELLPATDISACRWHAASFSHPFLCHLAAHQNSSWQIYLCHPSSTDLCAIRGCKTALAACPLLQDRHPKLRRKATQRISCRLSAVTLQAKQWQHYGAWLPCPSPAMERTGATLCLGLHGLVGQEVRIDDESRRCFSCWKLFR